MREPVPFKWRGIHHLYYGLWFIGFGTFFYWMNIDNGVLTELQPLWLSIIGIGVITAVDDIIEHTITGNTPLRIIHEKIIIPILRKKHDKNSD